MRMKLSEKGLPEKAVLAKLESELKGDFTYHSGRILGSMCTSPHEFGRHVYMKCLEKNLGDPGLFRAATQLEQKALGMLGSLLSHPNACGHIVSGGTEANILALWAARNLAKNRRREVVVPISAHCSFDKAANLLGLRLIKVKLNDRFQMDVKETEEAVTEKTVAIVGVAGTTGLGVVDPIHELSEIALAHDVYFHVDGAFGGFVLPFLEELGSNVPDFDFRVPGVCSVTVDPHKMGLAPIPSGGILFRNEEKMRSISTSVPYLAGGGTEHTTILGTRSGASAIAVWALLMHLGRQGYRGVVARCMRLTSKLVDGIRRINGVSLKTNPALNIVGITSNELDIESVAGELRRMGWAISLFPSYIRVVVMPHVSPSHIEHFLQDLKETVEKLGG